MKLNIIKLKKSYCRLNKNSSTGVFYFIMNTRQKIQALLATWLGGLNTNFFCCTSELMVCIKCCMIT
ncbi:hypothetical protein BH11BAC4_BH11BAC4_20630 [soil metagenome]